MIDDALLMAFDPGGTTGFAVSTRVIGGGRLYHTGTFDMAHQVWELIRSHKPDKVAFETFSTGGRVDVAMAHTLELVGSIRGVCHVLGIRAYGQMPQSRKAFLEQAQGLLKGTRHTKHEEDALAHLLLLEWRIAEGKL